MSSSEFSIIDEFFTVKYPHVFEPVLGVGDDCAVLDIPNDKQLAVSTDTLVEGVHFLKNSDPQHLGHKVLAVNLSDLAAMGATPAWVSLAITLPHIDREWLSAFSKGFFSLAEKHALHLIGGDTTQGPLSITITVMGLLPSGQRLTRAEAKKGDGIYVSGSIGSAGLGLLKARSGVDGIADRDIAAYLCPIPQVQLGQKLLTLASSCIDVSDGLSADLNHILKASGVGATLYHADMPLSNAVQCYMSEIKDELWAYSRGDDYELCFTVPNEVSVASVTELLEQPITKIGVIDEEKGLRIQMKNGEKITLNKGYEHFNES